MTSKWGFVRSADFLPYVLFVLLLSRLLFWASGNVKICTNFIWGQLCVKVKVVPFLFQAFCQSRTHASIFIGISKQMKSSPFSSWSFHLCLKTCFWWLSQPLTTYLIKLPVHHPVLMNSNSWWLWGREVFDDNLPRISMVGKKFSIGISMSYTRASPSSTGQSPVNVTLQMANGKC